MLIAHTYRNANSYTDSYANCNVDTDAYVDSDTNPNGNPDSYAKAFTYTAASSDAATSPIADKRVVINVEWLGSSRENLASFPAEAKAI